MIKAKQLYTGHYIVLKLRRETWNQKCVLEFITNRAKKKKKKKEKRLTKQTKTKQNKTKKKTNEKTNKQTNKNKTKQQKKKETNMFKGIISSPFYNLCISI